MTANKREWKQLQPASEHEAAPVQSPKHYFIGHRSIWTSVCFTTLKFLGWYTITIYEITSGQTAIYSIQLKNSKPFLWHTLILTFTGSGQQTRKIPTHDHPRNNGWNPRQRHKSQHSAAPSAGTCAWFFYPQVRATMAKRFGLWWAVFLSRMHEHLTKALEFTMPISLWSDPFFPVFFVHLEVNKSWITREAGAGVRTS